MVEEQSRSICDVILIQNCKESCPLLHPHGFKRQSIGFRFKDETLLFHEFKMQMIVLYSKYFLLHIDYIIGNYLFGLPNLIKEKL